MREWKLKNLLNPGIYNYGYRLPRSLLLFAEDEALESLPWVSSATMIVRDSPFSELLAIVFCDDVLEWKADDGRDDSDYGGRWTVSIK